VFSSEIRMLYSMEWLPNRLAAHLMPLTIFRFCGGRYSSNAAARVRESTFGLVGAFVERPQQNQNNLGTVDPLRAPNPSVERTRVEMTDDALRKAVVYHGSERERA
jgi:hypothetical protein